MAWWEARLDIRAPGGRNLRQKKFLVMTRRGSTVCGLPRLTCVSVAATEAGRTAGTAAALERGKGLGTYVSCQ